MNADKHARPCKRKRRVVLAMAATAVAIPALVWGQTDTWTGTTNVSWSTSTNWSGGVPTTSSNVVFPTPVPSTGSSITLASGEQASTLTFNDSYSLNGGVLTLAASSSNLNVAAGKTVTINSTLGGSGLDKELGGTAILTATDTFSGATTIGGGTLQIGNGGTSGSVVNSGSIVDNATLSFNRSDAITYTAIISGSGALNQIGSGTLVLGQGGASFTGLTTIAGGTLQLGSGVGGVTLGGNILDNGSLVMNYPSGTFVPNSFNISGTGSLTQAGAGTTILTGSDTRTGATVISAGALQIGNGGSTGSITGNILDNGSLAFVRNNSFSYAGTISGTGSVSQLRGTLTLSGTNSYTGATNFNAGGILVASADVNLGVANAPLAFASGTLRFGSSFNLSPDRAITLNTGGGTLDTNAFSSTVSQGITGTGSLTKTGSGILMLTGTSSYSGGTTITGGTLVIGTGNIPGNSDVNVSGGTLDIGASNVNVGAVTTGSIGSTIAGTGTLTGTSYAFGGGTVSAALGGSAQVDCIGGVTTLSGGNTYTGGTFVNGGGLAITSDANLGAANGAIAFNGGTLSYPANFSFSPTRAVTLNGSGLLLPAGDSTFAASVTGTGDLQISGGGTLSLTGSNTYLGGTTIENGATVLIANDVALGDSNGPLTLSSATLKMGGSIAVAPSRIVNVFGGTIDTNGFVTTIAASITGSDLTKAGAGTLVLSGGNSHFETILEAGVLSVSSDANLGFSGAVIDFNGGTLQLGAAFNLAATRLIQLDSGGGTIDTNGFNTTVASSFGGSATGTFTKAGLGTLTLNGSSTFSGGVNVTGGTLVWGQGSSANGVSVAAGTLDIGATTPNFGTLSIAPVGTLGIGGGTLSVSSVLTNAGTISGYGAIPNDITNSGTVQAKSGNLVIGEAGTMLTSSGTLQNLVGSNLFIQAGTVNNTGNITVNAAGSVVFDAAVTNTSGNTVALRGGALSTPTLTNNAGGTVNGFGQLTGDFVNNGAATFYAPMVINGNLTNASGGTLTVQATQTEITGMTTNNGNIHVQTGGNIYFLGGLSGNGPMAPMAITMDNGAAGTLTAPTINQSAMTIGTTDLVEIAGPGLSVLSGEVDNSGTLVIDSGTTSLRGGGTHNGLFTVRSAATLEFGGGTHTINSPTAISGPGTASVTSGAVNLASGLNVNGFTLAESGGSVMVSGTMTVTDSANTAVNLTGGTLTVGALDSTANEARFFSGWTGGTLAITGPGTSNLGNLNVDAVTLSQSGGTIDASVLGMAKSGSYSLSGSGNLVVSGSEQIGINGATGIATFYQSGGTHSTGSGISLGQFAGSSGTYILSGGSVSDNGAERVGNLGTGTFIQTGGTHAVTVSLNVGSSVGSNGSYSLSGSSSLLNVTGNESIGASGNATFTQSGGTNVSTGTLRIAVNSGSSAVYTLNGGSVTAASASINSNGSFQFNGGQASLGNLSINGTGQLLMSAGRNKTLVLSGLSISGNSVLDLSDNSMIVNYSASDTTHSVRNAIRNLLKIGRNGAAGQPGAWNGLGGITCSFAHNNGNGFNLAVGYGDNEDIALVRGSGSYTSFGGQTVSSNTVLVQMTRGADATLDGVVDAQDVTIVGSHFNKPNSGQWVFGDFDYSGTCDATDVTTLGSTFGKTTPALSPAAMTAEFGSAFTQAFEGGQAGAVPEPASLTLLGLGGLGLITRRRKRRL